ncbi:MAG: PAS domain-containing protein [Anaerolineae bacterium]
MNQQPSSGLSPAAEARLHYRALAAASCGITIADARLPDMPLIYVNDAFCTISGYAPGEVLGRNCRFLQGPERSQPALTELRAAVREGRSCTVTLRNYRKDGTLFWNDLHMAPVHDTEGNLTHFVGVQTDITARVEAEEALLYEQDRLQGTLRDLRETQTMLVHAEKMNALGQMVASLAHEINNPLAYVYGNLYSLLDVLRGLIDAYDVMETRLLSTGSREDAAVAASAAQLADIEFVRGDFEGLIAASLEGLERVKQLVLALRNFARLDESEDKIAFIPDCVYSALTIAAAVLGNRVSVTVELDGLPAIRCYPAELNQVFLNLIVNAAQAIPLDRRGWIHIGGRDAGDSLVLTVADSGSGMAPEVQAKIFTPFFTTKPPGEGVGLGLAIAYRIITERHHGVITVESAPDAGTTFTIELPKDGLG